MESTRSHPHCHSDSDLSDDSDFDQEERANGVEVVNSAEHTTDFAGANIISANRQQTELGAAAVHVRSESSTEAKGESDSDIPISDDTRASASASPSGASMDIDTPRAEIDLEVDVDDELELQSFSSAMNRRMSASLSRHSHRDDDADDESKSTSSEGTAAAAESFDFGGLADMVQMMRSHELPNGTVGVDAQSQNEATGRLTGASAALQRLRISLFFVFIGQMLSHFLVPISLVLLQPTSFYLVALYAFLTESAGLWQFGLGRRIDSMNRLTAVRRLLTLFWLGLAFVLIGVAVLHNAFPGDQGPANLSSTTFVLVYGAMCVCGWLHKLGQYGLRRALLADWYFVVASNSDGSADFKSESIVHDSVASKSHFHVRSLHMLSEVLLTLPIGAWLLVSDPMFVAGFFAVVSLISFWGTYTWLGWVYYDVLQLHAMKETLTSRDPGESKGSGCFPRRPRTRVEFARTAMMSSPEEDSRHVGGDRRPASDEDEIDNLSDGGDKNGGEAGAPNSTENESASLRSHDQLGASELEVPPVDCKKKQREEFEGGDRFLADQRSPSRSLLHTSLSPRGMQQVSYAPPFSFWGSWRCLYHEDVFTSIIISALMRFTVLGPSVLMVGFMKVQGISTILIGVWASSMGGAAFIGSYVVTNVARSKSSGGIVTVTRAITLVYFLVALAVMCLFVLWTGRVMWGMICILPATFAMTGSLVGQKMIVELEAPPLFHDALNTMEHVLTSGFLMLIFFSGVFFRLSSEFKYLAVLSFVGVTCASAMLLFWTRGAHSSAFAGHQKLDGTSRGTNSFAHMHSKDEEDSLELGVVDSLDVRAGDVLGGGVDVDNGESSSKREGRHRVHLDENDADLGRA